MYKAQELSIILKKYEKYFKGKFVGCTKKEVEKLEFELGIKLPAAYIEFLYVMGASSADLFDGANVHYPDILEMTNWSKSLAKENKVTLAIDIFVFFYNQDYSFFYFNIENSIDDPIVYMFLCGDEVPTISQLSSTFSNYLIDTIDMHVKMKMFRLGELKSFPKEGEERIVF
jgi:hypothetical protein